MVRGPFLCPELPLLDLNKLKSAAEAGDGTEEVPITRNCLAQIVTEISAGREAHAKLGQVLGLQGKAL